MAVTITATAGSASANSYVTLAEYNTFIEGIYPAPETATDDNKNRALVTFCQEMGGLRFKGARVDNTQALDWPRAGVTNPESTTGEDYDDDEIPGRVKKAQMLGAMAMLAGEYVPSGANADAVKRFKAPNVEIEFTESSGARSVSVMPESVGRELKPLLVPAQVDRN